jgi:hypothetical protein
MGLLDDYKYSVDRPKRVYDDDYVEDAVGH